MGQHYEESFEYFVHCCWDLKDFCLSFWCAKALPVPYHLWIKMGLYGRTRPRANIWFLCNFNKLEKDQQKSYRNAGAFPRILGVLRVPGDNLDTCGLNELSHPTRPRKFSNNGEKRYIIYFTFIIFFKSSPEVET